MNRLSNTLFLFIVILFCAVFFASCNKDNNTHSTTKIKCVTCANGGLCIHDSCQCPSGYEGVTCQTASIQKFMGNWEVLEKGTITPSRQYSIQIENILSSFTTVQISEFYEFFPVITANISTDSIYIPVQYAYGKKIEGKGYIHSDPTFGNFGAMTMTYMVTDTATGQVDDFGYHSPATSPSQWEK